MNIQFLSFTVPDQQRAVEFYTNVLGFVKHADIDMGGGQRWLTVIAAGRPQMELSLEPQSFEPARVYQRALFEAGIPVTAFTTDDIAADYARLTTLGVVFRAPPREIGPILTAVFEDTCGNLINLVQPLMKPDSSV